MQRIYRYRMTTTSGGNLSIRDDRGDIWITPARVDKGTLRRDDMVCVHPDGSFTGGHRPSSEFPFHRSIYQTRPDIGGIVHAHSVALVAFSITGSVPDTRLFHKGAAFAASQDSRLRAARQPGLGRQHRTFVRLRAALRGIGESRSGRRRRRTAGRFRAV